MKLDLNKITIVSINGRDPENSERAINYSSKDIKFREKIIISDKNVNFDGIKCIKVESLKDLNDYNYFCIKELYKYIETDYCLIVQPDGFVVNPYLWTDFFLEYDYIGAPWDYGLTQRALDRANFKSDIKHIVGNGGFSLRSKKLLDNISHLDYNNTDLEEDIFISISCRSKLKEIGIKYAPLDIAQQFSMESYINNKSIIGNSFGFHGSVKHFPHFKVYMDLLK